MAILNELRALYFIILRSLEDFFDEYGFNIGRYVRAILIMVAIILVTSGGYFGYRWYIVSREQNAHQAIADYMRDYRLAMNLNTPTEWQRIDGLLAIGYAQHKESHLAPFFLMLRAEALVRQNNMVEAINVLEQATNALPVQSSIKSLFIAKRALILLDHQDEAMQKEGLQQLISLARDKSNPYNDLALFYLGRYYWAHNNLQDAQKAWQELVDNSVMEKAYPSPWVKEAKNSLKQIIE